MWVEKVDSERREGGREGGSEGERERGREEEREGGRERERDVKQPRRNLTQYTRERQAAFWATSVN
jgi:hypothetical protein